MDGCIAHRTISTRSGRDECKIVEDTCVSLAIGIDWIKSIGLIVNRIY